MDPADKKIILFDGVCNLCNASVQFVLKRDRKKQFRFASLQSDAGRQLLSSFGLPVDAIHSFVLIEGERAYERSTALLRVCRQLGAAWPMLYILIIIPKFIRDPVYNLIARNRYKWFGKREECWLPGDDLKSRFLE
ncbi:MAG: thiol-disulfide oxidoreductase DCC family protein [Chitinophagales bacterium]